MDDVANGIYSEINKTKDSISKLPNESKALHHHISQYIIENK